MTEETIKQPITMEQVGELHDKLASICPDLAEVAKTFTNLNKLAPVVRSGISEVDKDAIAKLGSLREDMTSASNHMQDIGLLSSDDVPYAGKDVGAACDAYLKQ